MIDDWYLLFHFISSHEYYIKHSKLSTCLLATQDSMSDLSESSCSFAMLAMIIQPSAVRTTKPLPLKILQRNGSVSLPRLLRIPISELL
jgi:hypothetical protein